MKLDQMNSRERMLAAIRREPVDRVPTDIWATGEVWAKLRNHFDAGTDIAAALHIDGMSGVGAAYIGLELKASEEGGTVDIWGVRTRRVAHNGGFYDEQSSFPLADVQCMDDLDHYTWPTTDWFDYSGMRAGAQWGGT